MAAALILASGSRYRRQLLERLRVPFHVFAAHSDETPLTNESPRDLVVRLARTKAQSVSTQFPEALVIGADQVAVCRGRVVGKPGTAERNVGQLREASGQSVEFLTAVCLAREADNHLDRHVDTTTVHFRPLTDAEIARYVEIEQAFDCAGGFKVESLGVSLFDRIDSQDPSALVGLPLIWLAGALRRAGLM